MYADFDYNRGLEHHIVRVKDGDNWYKAFVYADYEEDEAYLGVVFVEGPKAGQTMDVPTIVSNPDADECDEFGREISGLGITYLYSDDYIKNELGNKLSKLVEEMESLGVDLEKMEDVELQKQLFELYQVSKNLLKNL